MFGCAVCTQDEVPADYPNAHRAKQRHRKMTAPHNKDHVGRDRIGNTIARGINGCVALKCPPRVHFRINCLDHLFYNTIN